MDIAIALIIGILVCIVLGAIIGVVFKLLIPRLLDSVLKSIILGITFLTIGEVIAAILIVTVFRSVPAIYIILPFAIISPIIGFASYAVITKPKDSTTPNTIKFSSQQPLQTNTYQSSAQHEFQVKICPTCHQTYPDISLNFCLNDGMPLSNVLNVQSPHDPEKTIISQKVR